MNIIMIYLAVGVAGNNINKSRFVLNYTIYMFDRL